ncbi:hypothetical protein TNIN_456381 [Trichonephila inaurata madagascariensis]|uniref:Uncharacterized protein n=1 Tax=Trichonephila inaurata madagascariensis TaxID=2747483 RepID=A0A8X6X6U2_9ARAC|nr:hypothetical protein TNIN_456381 [Trichonephila inaurata madagascariensis]
MPPLLVAGHRHDLMASISGKYCCVKYVKNDTLSHIGRSGNFENLLFTSVEDQDDEFLKVSIAYISSYALTVAVWYSTWWKRKQIGNLLLKIKRIGSPPFVKVLRSLLSTEHSQEESKNFRFAVENPRHILLAGFLHYRCKHHDMQQYSWVAYAEKLERFRLFVENRIDIFWNQRFFVHDVHYLCGWKRAYRVG